MKIHRNKLHSSIASMAESKQSYHTMAYAFGLKVSTNGWVAYFPFLYGSFALGENTYL